MKLRHAVLLLALAGCLCPKRVVVHPLTLPPEGKRTTVFISDLHMGPGLGGDGQWHHYEDSRWSADFVAFLAKVDEAGGGATDLVVLGDGFELWQSPTSECGSRNPDKGCTERETIFRLDRAIQDHPAEIEALGAFARSGENRLYFVPGNHDAAILFPGASARLVEALAAPGRVSVPPTGSWLSRDGRVYAEHGHQIPGDLNAYDDWPDPFIGLLRPRLRRSWGEQFVRSFYNPYERNYPVIDNINSKLAGVSYGLAHERLPGLGTAIGRFLRFALTQTSPSQWLGAVRDASGAPPWDVDAIRAQGGAFLLASVPEEERAELEALAGEDRAELDAEAAALTDEEILAICDERAEPSEDDSPRVEPCPTRSGVGATARSASASKRRALGERLASSLTELRRSLPGQAPFKVFIWGHSHVAETAHRVEAPEGWGADVMNSGAWQRVVSKKWYETAARKKGLPRKDWITGFQLEELPRCYSFIRVPADGGAPRLRYWTGDADGAFAEADSCVAACRRAADCGIP